MNQPGSERRQYKRFTKHFILTYYDLHDPKIRHDASQLKNISLGGMCLVTGKPFPFSTKMGIDLKTPFLSQQIHVEGVVLESQEKIKDIIYETRVQFLNLTPDAQFVLKKLIDHFEIEKGPKNE